MKYLDNDKQKEKAVQGRFYCSDKIACFDVSPEMDYLVCECRDETIHLFSLQTGIKVWVRPAPLKTVKREYFCRDASVSGAYRQIGHFLSFYNSVIFHPNGKSVLPGTLQYVYTISGDREVLYPDSDCSFSNCVYCKDKNVMLTDCPDSQSGFSFGIWRMVRSLELSILMKKFRLLPCLKMGHLLPFLI